MVVDASSSEVFASTFPARGSAAYLLVALVGFIIFLVLGFVATVSWCGLGPDGPDGGRVFFLSLTVARRM